MSEYDIYNDIDKRTGGDIYIGVVGPVRTGKSTFIKRFMNLLVIPAIEDENDKKRTKDELPQSAAGKTIMTTEPKFIPKEAARIHISKDSEVNVRLIDCVGFMVEGASGHEENGSERMVKTPWFDYEIPFTKAAKIGTQKVIRDHSTVGIVITTDGSVGELSRNAYVKAEQETIEELRQLNKPFIIILNSQKPYSEETKKLARQLQETYGVSTLALNCEQLKKDDIYEVMRLLLNEFPVVQIEFNIPKWMEILPYTHPLKNDMIQNAKQILERITYMRDVTMENISYESENINEISIADKNLSNGVVKLRVGFKEPLYYQVLSESTGIEITGEFQLMKMIAEFAKMKSSYQKVEGALKRVQGTGYGVVTPEKQTILIDDPVLVKHGNKYGVKMKASANSIHMIRSVIETEIAPIVGSEQQAQDLITYIKTNAAKGPEGIWQTNIFGKSIEQIVADGMQTKVSQMTETCQLKMQEALQKIINDSNGGVICIII